MKTVLLMIWFWFNLIGVLLFTFIATVFTFVVILPIVIIHEKVTGIIAKYITY